MRRGWTEKELAARELAQWSVEKKRCRADDVVTNTGDLNDLARQIEDWFAKTVLNDKCQMMNERGGERPV